MSQNRRIKASRETEAYENFCATRSNKRRERQSSSSVDPSEVSCCVHGTPCETSRSMGSTGRSRREVRLPSEKSEDKVHGMGVAYKRRHRYQNAGLTGPAGGVCPPKSPATLALTAKAEKLHPKVEKYALERPSDALLKYYIGNKSKREAEKLCYHRGSFRIYHRYPTGKLKDFDSLLGQIPLFVAYRGVNGARRHWPILTRQRPYSKDQLYVGTKITPPIYFDTLAGLVFYYAKCVAIYKNAQQKLPDRFPVWLSTDPEEVTVAWEPPSFAQSV
ncbi:unnamed protein product [Bursaphelenchus okinawaensis]|uniref:SH2 domain-containing protein n=1 Tax=Bursaphelenchus okinawaensis TaxID=465554 RepID=A0A811JUG3_9BILA|nr:unnamed protein product [Bursaphelenchus okinawaensis]CAG9084325.1 unnamed protein product [Bursaphelenchus okinawaensis]